MLRRQGPRSSIISVFFTTPVSVQVGIGVIRHPPSKREGERKGKIVSVCKEQREAGSAFNVFGADPSWSSELETKILLSSFT